MLHLIFWDNLLMYNDKYALYHEIDWKMRLKFHKDNRIMIILRKIEKEFSKGYKLKIDGQ